LCFAWSKLKYARETLSACLVGLNHVEHKFKYSIKWSPRAGNQFSERRGRDWQKPKLEIFVTVPLLYILKFCPLPCVHTGLKIALGSQQKKLSLKCEQTRWERMETSNRFEAIWMFHVRTSPGRRCSKWIKRNAI